MVGEVNSTPELKIRTICLIKEKRLVVFIMGMEREQVINNKLIPVCLLSLYVEFYALS